MRLIENCGPLRGRHVLLALSGITCAIAICAWLSASAVAGPACSDDFTGASAGAWGLALNWTSATDASEHAVPGTGDVVCLGGTTVDIASGSAHADSVQGGGGGIVIDGGQLALSSATDNSTIASLALDDAGEFSAPVGQTVTVTGNIEWGQCTSCGNAIPLDATIVQTAGSGGTLDIDGPGTGADGPVLQGGSITTSSPVSITNSLFNVSGSFALSTTSTLTLGTGVQLDGDDPQATFTAAAVSAPTGTEGFGPASLVLNGGTTTIGRNTTLQAGAITLAAGELQDDGGIQAAPGRTESLTINGGTLAGEGNLGPVTNVSGTVAPGDATPGTLTVSGTYTQDTGGTLDIGLGASSSFGQLQVFGAVQAGGDLVPELGSYTPASGQAWVVVLSETSVSGQFTLSGADASLVDAVYLASSVKLEGATGTTTTGTTTTVTGTTTTGTGTSTTGTGTTTTGGGSTTTGAGTGGSGAGGTGSAGSAPGAPTFKLSRPSVSNKSDAVSFGLTSSVTGAATARATFVRTVKTVSGKGKHHRTAHKTVLYATASGTAGAGRSLGLRLTPSKAVVRIVKSLHAKVKITVVVSFTPTGGAVQRRTFTVTLPKAKARSLLRSSVDA
jgi:hypothetical protein